MNEARAASRVGRPLWAKVLAGALALALLIALLLIFFPWDLLRGPLNRYVSDKTGRHFEITRRLDVKLGRNTRILADGIEFANPDWAQDPYLVKAQSAEIQVELLPLLRRRIVLPLVSLRQPQLGLQMEEDGRRSWALGRDSSDPANVPEIGAFIVDKGSMHFVAPYRGADIHTEFEIQAAPSAPAAGTATNAPAMPLHFKAKGTWQKEAFTAQGRTGNVLYLSAPLQQPFPIEVQAAAGPTALRASGTVASLATLEGANAKVDLQGQNLADLYKLVGVVLPATPRYAVQGHVSQHADVWQVRELNGKLGNSDLAGDLSFNRAQKVPMLTGNVKSKLLDFDDLAPLVGLPEQPRSAAALPQVAVAKPPKAAGAQPGPGRKVLPATPIDLSRLQAMNSDVSYSAARMTNVRKLPLDRMSVHVRLKDGVLQLDPMELGVAGGTLSGGVRIQGNSNPARIEVHLDARALELSKMFRDSKLASSSYGKIYGDIDLEGRGNTVAQMLASSSGNVVMLMGPGQFSNLLLEVAGLDGAEIIKFLTGGDRNVRLRCAASAFDVKNGAMSSRALLLDTADTVIYGQGGFNLAQETINIHLRPYPKDMSILSLRSPLTISGTFGAPKTGVDKSALAGRAGLALALGAINPLLALAATIETGPGQDANCGAILRNAASPDAAARAAVKSQQAQDEKRSATFGGPSSGGGKRGADNTGKPEN